jgi:hypothetical protein
VRFAFERLPGTGVDVARAALEVVVTGPDQSLSALCLMDTGSLHNRFGSWVADLAGIDLASADTERIGVGGTVTEATTVTCELRLGDFTWEAPDAFCDPCSPPPLIPALQQSRATARLTESGYQDFEPSTSLLNTKAPASSSCSHIRAPSTARARRAASAAVVVGSSETRRAAWFLCPSPPAR